MIHDLDLVLSLTCRPRLIEVAALGVTVLGPHEDVATARLVFADGCVANLSASRVSYHACREMQVWSPRGLWASTSPRRAAKVDLPAEAVLSGRLDIESLTASSVARFANGCSAIIYRSRPVAADERTRLADELADFAEAIVSGREPRVTGPAGREMLSPWPSRSSSQLPTIDWDGRQRWAAGPLPVATPATLAGPHWHRAAATVPTRQRQAG